MEKEVREVVLTRKKGEEIWIYNEEGKRIVKIGVEKVVNLMSCFEERKARVKIKICTPSNFKVHRAEIAQALGFGDQLNE